MRRHHGRIQDEGASGFLKTKVKATPQSDGVSENDWSLFDVLVKDENNPGPGSLMGTEKWASVYLADTPEQAAQMGLVLPGVDDVCDFNETNHYSFFIFCVLSAPFFYDFWSLRCETRNDWLLLESAFSLEESRRLGESPDRVF